MPTTAPRRSSARRTTPRTSRPSLPRRRKPEPQSNAQKILGAVTKALPSAAAAKKARPRGKGKNFALLGIAGGRAAAIKNRDKLSFGKKQPPEGPPPTR